MGFVVDGVKGLFSSPSDQIGEATEVAVAGQTGALDYLKEAEALPMEIRDQALTSLQDVYLGGGQQELVDQALNSPLYQALTANLNTDMSAAEDAILRNQSMTGGFRSGNTHQALAKNALNQQNIEAQMKNKALIDTYNQSIGGITGLAGMGGNTSQIANLIGNIGSTEAQGMIAQSQAMQDQAGGLMDLASMAGMLYFMSDQRLKDKITYRVNINGVNIYSWVWNKAAEKFGLSGAGIGPIAQEVEKTHPDMVTDFNGFKAIVTEPFEAVING